MTVEIEFKLRFPASAARAVAAHPALAVPAEQRHRRKLLTFYFDTPDFALWRAGIALRVRREAGRWIQSVKFGGEARGGLHRREEAEMPLASAHPDLPGIAGAKLRRKLVTLAGGRLGIAFRTEFWRDARLIEPVPGVMIEAAIDRGRVAAGKMSETLCELELELRRGDAAALLRLARELAGDLPLSPDDRSKAERGYRLAGAPPLPPASTVKATKDLRAGDAFPSFLGRCLGKLGQEREKLLVGYDIEAMHQTRVALRQARTALALWQRGLHWPKDEALTRELSWLGEQLGNARDWDVFCASDMLAAKPRHFKLAAGQLRKEARRRALDALGSERYTRLMLDLAATLVAWECERSNTPLSRVARKLLALRYRRALEAGAALCPDDARSRHRLRIAVKRLRYATDVLAPAFQGKHSRFLKALARLQDLLGEMNDRDVALRLAEVLGNSLGLRTLPIATAPPPRQMETLERDWRRFRAMDTFW